MGTTRPAQNPESTEPINIPSLPAAALAPCACGMWQPCHHGSARWSSSPRVLVRCPTTGSAARQRVAERSARCVCLLSLALLLSLRLSSPSASAGLSPSKGDTSSVAVEHISRYHRRGGVRSKSVLAHYMLSHAAYGFNKSAYTREIALAHEHGVDGFGLEVLGNQSYYMANMATMYDACEEYNSALPAGQRPFWLFPIINFCCTLDIMDALPLYSSYHHRSCAFRLEGKPVFATWAGVKATDINASVSNWTSYFFEPIKQAGLPRPFFLPFIFAGIAAGIPTDAPHPTVDEVRLVLRDTGTIVDGFWYWGAAALGDQVARASRAVVQACRGARKYAATPVSAPYSPHIGKRNRYVTGHGATAMVDIWLEHVRSQPEMVIFSTWNDVCEHHYVGPYKLTKTTGDKCSNPYNTFPHLAYLELSSYFIEWYKQPHGSRAPDVRREQLYYFYNLQPVNNRCPGDYLGAPAIYNDSAFEPEDQLYATLLLNASASIAMTSGGGDTQVFNAIAGLHSFKVPRYAGPQRLRVTRGPSKTVLVDVVGAELVNSSHDPAVTSRCDHQTFSGSASW